MSRACCLAGCGAGLVAVFLIVLLVVLIPHVRAPVIVVRQGLLGILDRAGLGAKLLAELYCAGGAYLNALAAGDALFGIDMGTVSGCGHIGGIEQLRGAQSVADAGCAVADGEDLVLAVDVGYLVDIALFLGALEHFHDLLIGSIVDAFLAGLIAVLCGVADSDTPMLGQVAGATVITALAVTAGANADLIVIVLLQPVGQMLDGDRLRLMLNCLLNGDNMHADTCAAGRHHCGDILERKSGHVLEELRYLGVLIHGSGLHVKKFCAAGDEQGHEPLLVVVVVLPVVLQNAQLAHLLELCLQLCLVRPLGELLDLVKCQRLALRHGEQDLYHLIVEDIAQTPVFGIGFGQRLQAELLRDAVGELFSEFEQIFFVCYHAKTPFDHFIMSCNNNFYY